MLLRCRCSVAGWSGRWSGLVQSVVWLAVRSVVRSLIWSASLSVIWSVVWLRWCCGGAVSGPRYGPVVRLAVRSVIWSGTVVRSVVRSVVVIRTVRSVVRRNTSCSIQWPASFKCSDIGRKGLVFCCNLCSSQKPGPGSAHTLPTKCGPRCFLAQVVGVHTGPRSNCFTI